MRVVVLLGVAFLEYLPVSLGFYVVNSARHGLHLSPASPRAREREARALTSAGSPSSIRSTESQSPPRKTMRSEERRVGKEGVSTGRSRWRAVHSKNKVKSSNEKQM